MIVADANLIAALVMPVTGNTADAEQILLKDRDWASPALWRSELCNVLATAVRNGVMPIKLAIDAMDTAEQVMAGSEFAVSSVDTLKLATEAGCTAYDAEYALVAKELDVPLLTYDKKLLREFPELAIHPKEYVDRAD